MNTNCLPEKRAKKLEPKLMIENELAKVGSSSLVFHAGVIGQGLKDSAQPNSFNKVSVPNFQSFMLLVLGAPAFQALFLRFILFTLGQTYCIYRAEGCLCSVNLNGLCVCLLNTCLRVKFTNQYVMCFLSMYPLSNY